MYFLSKAEQLKHTMLCYFDSQYNLKRSADTLGLHVNIVCQRLEIIRELTGNLDDQVRAFLLQSVRMMQENTRQPNF